MQSFVKHFTPTIIQTENIAPWPLFVKTIKNHHNHFYHHHYFLILVHLQLVTFIKHKLLRQHILAQIRNGNARTLCKICSKSRMQTPERQGINVNIASDIRTHPLFHKIFIWSEKLKKHIWFVQGNQLFLCFWSSKVLLLRVQCPFYSFIYYFNLAIRCFHLNNSRSLKHLHALVWSCLHYVHAYLTSFPIKK